MVYKREPKRNIKLFKRTIKYLLHRNYKVIITEDKNILDKIYRFRYNMYCIKYKFLDPENYPDQKEIDEYDTHSVHLAVIDNFDNIIGTARLIKNIKTSLPTEKEYNLKEVVDKIRSNGIAEISRLVIDDKYKKTFVFFDLIKTLYKYSRKHDINYWLCSVEEWLYNYIKSFFGEIKLLSKQKFIFNTWNYPCLIDIEEFQKSLKRKSKLLYLFFKI